ncbi:hypothetical protein PM082_012010 [Marasmius tenuissimus]|nr:hypothetical protein PM082_012010 [Marasmius tenuissimus]
MIDAVQEYTRKSDCFRQATARIHSRCEQLDMIEEERVGGVHMFHSFPLTSLVTSLPAAISMTLCELATAKYYSIPMECNSFTISQSSFNVTIDSGLSSECVSALSRSAQFWSSYSGYLREIPQLCFAFQRWNDIDVARNIYHNITLEKLALVRLMQERELEEKFSAERWSLGMVELINTVAFIQNISQQLDVRLDIQTREVGRSLSNVATTMEKRAGTILDNSIRNLSHIVSASLISDLGLIAISQLNFSIGSTMSSFDEAIHLRLEKAFSSLLERQQESAKIAVWIC